MSPTGTIYMVNRIGPMTDLCGIHELNEMEANLLHPKRRSPITKAWVLSVKYDLNQLRVTPVTANLVSSLLSRML